MESSIEMDQYTDGILMLLQRLEDLSVDNPQTVRDVMGIMGYHVDEQKTNALYIKNLARAMKRQSELDSEEEVKQQPIEESKEEFVAQDTLEKMTCHICLVDYGYYVYKPHEKCRSGERLCNECFEKLTKDKAAKCPICRTALAQAIIQYDQPSHQKIIVQSIQELLRCLFVDALQIVGHLQIIQDRKGSWKIPVFEWNKPSPNARVILDSAGIIWLREGLGASTKIGKETDCLVYDADSSPDQYLHLLLLYQDFPTVGKNWKGLVNVDMKGIYKFLRSHAFNQPKSESMDFKFIGKRRITALWQAVNQDKDREQDPLKYRILDYLNMMYLYDQHTLDVMQATKYLKFMLSTPDAFRAASPRYKIARHSDKSSKAVTQLRVTLNRL